MSDLRLAHEIELAYKDPENAARNIIRLENRIAELEDVTTHDLKPIDRIKLMSWVNNYGSKVVLEEMRRMLCTCTWPEGIGPDLRCPVHGNAGGES